jgi:hypothetical protein
MKLEKEPVKVGIWDFIFPWIAVYIIGVLTGYLARAVGW